MSKISRRELEPEQRPRVRTRASRRELEPEPATGDTPNPSSIPVDAVDHLTSRWLAALPSDCKGTVFSTVGVWPLLAILADVATPEMRAKLEQALGITLPPPSEAPNSAKDNFTDMAKAVIHALDNSAGTTAALGLWFSKRLEARKEWVAALPTATVQILPGTLEGNAKAVTKWANEKTHGMIPNLEIQPYAGADFVLASAVTLRTTWETEFKRHEHSGHLKRTTREEGTVRTGREVTTVCIRGGGGDTKGEQSERDGGDEQAQQHDVYLVLGKADASPGTVLAKGLEAIRGRGDTTLLTQESALEMEKSKTLGPGIYIHTTYEVGKNLTPYVHVNVPSFNVQAKTGLVTDEFGLTRITEGEGVEDQYPGIASNMPITITDGFQIARAGFDAKGFEAAAFSVLLGKGGAYRPPSAKKVVHFATYFNRPFGFLAVERGSGLLLFAGWVTEDEWTETQNPTKRQRKE